MEEYCMPCEASGRDKVLGTNKVLFNGDIITCCDFCKDLIEKDLLFNEESNEPEEY